MTRTLVAQAESTQTIGQHRFGYEVFEEGSDFVLVIHTSTYEGIRRSSHYATPGRPLDAFTKEAALEEAARETAAYARAVTGA